MSDLTDRLAVYSMNDHEEVPHAVKLILDALAQVGATIDTITQALASLDALDDLRAAQLAALAARVAALEPSHSVKV